MFTNLSINKNSLGVKRIPPPRWELITLLIITFTSLFLIFLINHAYATCEERASCPSDKYPTCTKSVGSCAPPNCVEAMYLKDGVYVLDCAHPLGVEDVTQTQCDLNPRNIAKDNEKATYTFKMPSSKNEKFNLFIQEITDPENTTPLAHEEITLDNNGFFQKEIGPFNKIGKYYIYLSPKTSSDPLASYCGINFNVFNPEGQTCPPFEKAELSEADNHVYLNFSTASNMDLEVRIYRSSDKKFVSDHYLKSGEKKVDVGILKNELYYFELWQYKVIPPPTAPICPGSGFAITESPITKDIYSIIYSIIELCHNVKHESDKLEDLDKQPKPYQDCVNCLKQKNSVWTALGCIQTDVSGFVSSFFKVGLGLAGGIAFLFLIYGGFMVLTSAGNPETVQQGKQIITSAIAGLLLIIFSVLLLQIISVDILKIPEFE